MNTVAIVIPIYQDTLSEFDKISLDRCFEVLGKYPIIAVTPSSLNIDGITRMYRFSNIRTFDDYFFANIDGYNNLMTAQKFYEAFLDYKYVLIHQLDAFVFKDQLASWCEQQYDYIGAPWLWDNGHKSWHEEFKFRIQQRIWIFFNKKNKHNNLPIDEQFRDMVGNGGLSLRNVRKFYDLIKANRSLIDYYNDNNEHHFYNEDVFWAIEVNRRSRKLKIPSYRTASLFAMENGLERGLMITKGQLPFGCHDWDRNRDFWRPYFKSAGYNI